MKRHLSGVLALSILVLAPSSAVYPGTLDDTIVSLMQKRNIPGLSIAIVEESKIVKARGYGITKRDGHIAVTEHTLFQAGSISKPVAAFGALRLVGASKCALDANVNDALSSWKVPENEFTKTEKVTLRRLLSHTAGLNIFHFPGYSVADEKPTLLQVLDGEKPSNTAPVRVEFIPGTQWRYSGGGYEVVQQLVIDASGQNFPDYMRDFVFTPFEMHESTYEQTLPESRMKMTATGHYPGAKPVLGRWHVYPEMAAAGLWTTPSDLAKFLIGVQDAAAGKKGALLKPEIARLMLTREKENYGLGFFLEGNGENQRFAHDGRDDGFDAQLVAYTNKSQGAVIMINANENSSFMKQVLAAVVEEYKWPDYRPFMPPEPIVDNNPAFTARIRKIFEDAQQGRIESEQFTERLASKLSALVSHPEFVHTIQMMGSVRSIALTAATSGSDSQNLRFRIVLEHDVVLADCTLDRTGKISVLTIQPE